MLVKLATWGNSLAFRIPAGVAKEVGAKKDALADVTIKEGKLIVSLIDAEPSFDLDDLVSKITDTNRHDEVTTGHAVGYEFH